MKDLQLEGFCSSSAVMDLSNTEGMGSQDPLSMANFSFQSQSLPSLPRVSGLLPQQMPFSANLPHNFVPGGIPGGLAHPVTEQTRKLEKPAAKRAKV